MSSCSGETLQGSSYQGGSLPLRFVSAKKQAHSFAQGMCVKRQAGRWSVPKRDVFGTRYSYKREYLKAIELPLRVILGNSYPASCKDMHQLLSHATRLASNGLIAPVRHQPLTLHVVVPNKVPGSCIEVPDTLRI